MARQIFMGVVCIAALSGCAKEKNVDIGPTQQWIVGNGRFGCTQHSDYENIYSRLVSGDRQGAARRIADASTSGRLVKFRESEEVVLLRERGDLVLIRRPNTEKALWTRKEAITPRKPERTMENQNPMFVAEPTNAAAVQSPAMTGMATPPRANLGTPVNTAEQSVQEEVATAEEQFNQWLKKNPAPLKDYYTWTSASTKHEIVGQLISVRNDDVTVKKKDGKEIVVSKAKLSNETNELLDAYAIPQLSAYRKKLDAWERAVTAKRKLLNLSEADASNE